MTIATREQELETVIRELAAINAKRDEYMKALERLQNAKAAEPKPPEGFAFSETPGEIDASGYALSWNTGEPDFRLTHVRGNAHPGAWMRWLVPATPKRETREEAEKRWKNYQALNFEFAHYGSFMRGAGFEP